MKKIIVLLGLGFTVVYMEAMIIMHNDNQKIPLYKELLYTINTYLPFSDTAHLACITHSTAEHMDNLYCKSNDLYAKRLLAQKYCITLLDNEEIQTKLPDFTHQLKEIYIVYEYSSDKCYFDTLEHMNSHIDYNENNDKAQIQLQDKKFFLCALSNYEGYLQLTSSDAYQAHESPFILDFIDVDAIPVDTFCNLQEHESLSLENEEELFFSCVNTNNKELLYALLEKGVNINMQDECGDTALIHACRKEHVDIVHILLDQDEIDVNKKSFVNNKCGLAGRPHFFVNKYENSALHVACIQNNSELVALLLAHPNINVNTTNFMLNTPLHCAYQNDNQKIIDLLRAHPDINVHMCNRQGYTPNQYAYAQLSTDCEIV